MSCQSKKTVKIFILLIVIQIISNRESNILIDENVSSYSAFYATRVNIP